MILAADANKQRSVPGAEWEAKDEAREYLPPRLEDQYVVTVLNLGSM